MNDTMGWAMLKYENLNHVGVQDLLDTVETEENLTAARSTSTNAELAPAALAVIIVGGILAVASAARIAAYVACKNKIGAFVDVTTRPPTVTPTEPALA